MAFQGEGRQRTHIALCPAHSEGCLIRKGPRQISLPLSPPSHPLQTLTDTLLPLHPPLLSALLLAFHSSSKILSWTVYHLPPQYLRAANNYFPCGTCMIPTPRGCYCTRERQSKALKLEPAVHQAAQTHRLPAHGPHRCRLPFPAATPSRCVCQTLPLPALRREMAFLAPLLANKHRGRNPSSLSPEPDSGPCSLGIN